MRFAGFIGPSYQLNSVNADAQRCINLYPELNELGTGKAREIAALLGTPGLLQRWNLTGGKIRGAITTSLGDAYVVCGTKIYELFSNYTSVEVGTLSTPSGHVSMADNGRQLVIVDGNNGYVVTLSNNAFAHITDPDFPGANTVAFLDQYFIFEHPNTGQYFISALADGTDYNALEFATAEGSPDNLVAVVAYDQKLALFGEDSTEFHFDSGATDFPFERIPGAVTATGLAATHSPAVIDDVLLFLGKDKHGAGIVYRFQGYQAVRVSNHAVENAIKSYGDVSNAKAYAYQDGGHSFYVLNFNDANTTWAYDLKTGLWHERSYLNQGNYERHRGDCHFFAFNKHFVGDYDNGKVYEMSSDIYSDNGHDIARRRRAPHFSEDQKLISHYSFQLDAEMGVGLDGNADSQDVDPHVSLRFSDDGGHTWSNEKTASIGKIGEYGKRCIFRRLGQSRDRVYEVTITAKVKVRFLGADVEVEKGAA